MKRLLLLTFIVLAGIPSAHAQFTFTSIDFPGGTLTTARGINNHGEIVGAYRIVPLRHALLVKDGQYIPLAPTTVLGTNFSEAFKANDRGDVVGQFFGDDGFFHGSEFSRLWRHGCIGHQCPRRPRRSVGLRRDFAHGTRLRLPERAAMLQL